MFESFEIIVIYITSGVATGILGYVTVHAYFRIINQSGAVSDGSLKEYLSPLGNFLAAKAEKSISIAQPVKKYELILMQSGTFWGGLNAYEILAAKYIFPIIFFVIIMLSGLIAGFEMDLVLIFAIFFMIMGYMYPDTTLNAQAEKRKKLFMKQLPGALDILKVAAESGLDFYSSVNYLVDIYIPGPLKDEMMIFQRELKLGIPTVTALTNIADRLHIPEATTIFISLSQSIEMGTSIIDMLEETTKEMRRKRLLSAEAEAQKAVVKITFPLLLLILPGIFIVLLAPVFNPMMKVFSNLAQ